jgi:hypothetical protein
MLVQKQPDDYTNSCGIGSVLPRTLAVLFLNLSRTLAFLSLLDYYSSFKLLSEF